MRILMTQRELCHRGGSEMFTIEVAVELKRRGHDVAVFSPRFGDLGKFLLAGGVWLKSTLEEIPWTPEVIHGQHHLQAVAAFTRFDRAPAIYHCHGLGPWVEKPPAHPRIRYYVMMSPAMALRVEPEFGLPRERIVTIANFVNLRRFSRVRSAPARLRRALLFGNDKLSADERFSLEDACTQESLTLDYIGVAYGNPQARPEVLLLDYDLVFAVGKCAMEALASGCAVIPVCAGQAGHLVTLENFTEWAFSNFSPPYYFRSAAQINANWLRSELRGYAAEDVSGVSARLRQEYDLEKAVDRLEMIYENAISDQAAQPPATGAAELGPYLESIGPEIDAMYVETIQARLLHERIRALEREVRTLRLTNKARELCLRPIRRLVGKLRSLIR
jgi:hypothetical protein